MRSGLVLDAGHGLGMAVVRLEALSAGGPLRCACGEARLTPRRPNWMAPTEAAGAD
jgi:hypothetical protein